MVIPARPAKPRPTFDPEMSLTESEPLSRTATPNNVLNDGKSAPPTLLQPGSPNEVWLNQSIRSTDSHFLTPRGSKVYSRTPHANPRRVIFKHGDTNVRKTNIRNRKMRFLTDIFTTMVDIQWRWNLLVFIVAFVGSWFLFASLWYTIGKYHGDFKMDNVQNPNFVPCVVNVHNFTSALLFSVETQHTIGYGWRLITDECPEGIVLLMLQCCFGVIIQALMTGIVFAKLARAKKRGKTLMFSKHAVIYQRDTKYCLVVRVGDMRRSHLIEAHCRAILVKKRVTREGEVLPMFQYELDVGLDTGRDRIFMGWPGQITHEIGEDSPFWDMSKQDVTSGRYEVIITLEGIIESTGMTTQARTSYMPSEIKWGYRFRNLMQYQPNDGTYWIDYSRFHDSVEVEMPTCSAKQSAGENSSEESSLALPTENSV